MAETTTAENRWEDMGGSDVMNWDTVASLATAIGVCIAAWQIWQSRKLAQTSFEDGLDQQYRNEQPAYIQYVSERYL